MHQSNSSSAQVPPETAGHLSALPVPRVGPLQILLCPGAGHLPTPGLFPSFWHTHSFLLEYNYTKRILQEKQAYWFISQGQETIEEVCKGTIVLDFMHVFLHCLSSQIYTVKSGAMDMNQRFSVMLKLNQISVDIIWRTSFIIYILRNTHQKAMS